MQTNKLLRKLNKINYNEHNYRYNNYTKKSFTVDFFKQKNNLKT